MVTNESIRVSGIYWEEFEPLFLEVIQIWNALEDDIDRHKYGSNTKTIYFLPMGIGDDFHEEYIGYDEEIDVFLIKKKLDYEALKTANVDQFLRMAATAFFEEIDQIQLPDFDTALPTSYSSLGSSFKYPYRRCQNA